MHALGKLLLFHVLTSFGHIALGAKIINGELVPERSMQYMVSVQNEANHHICGGFLISEDFVVTAAHCDLELSHVIVGTHDLRKVDSNKKIYIKERYKHFKYVSPGRGDDIMLLKLYRKATLDNSVQTISLPTSAMNIRENTPCRVAGWGYTRSRGETVDELRMVDVSVIDPEVCKKDWSGLPENVICAGGYNTTKGFCQGDSGGPLVCNGKAVGIVSFNYYEICTYPSKPNVYVDVSKYLEWIKEIIHKNACLQFML